jgi:hypothetical protein
MLRPYSMSPADMRERPCPRSETLYTGADLNVGKPRLLDVYFVSPTPVLATAYRPGNWAKPCAKLAQELRYAVLADSTG